MLGYRSGDAVLTLCQNNVAKSIEIVEMNDAAAALTGFAGRELAGRPFAEIVPARLAEMIAEYVEYEDDANDIGMVLSKMQSLGLVGKDRKEKLFRLKVVRGESTKEKLTFPLVLQGAVDARKDDALLGMIQENFKGHEVLHPQLGVPDRHSLEKNLEMLGYYHHKAGLRASFVLTQIDHMQSFAAQYNEAQCVAFLKHVMTVFRANLRPGDVVGAAGGDRIGMILLDSGADSTRMVANRLRWQIAAHPYVGPDKTPLTLSVSMVYANVNGKILPTHMLTSCENALAALPANAANHLSEVVG